MTPIEFVQTYWSQGLIYLILGSGIIQIAPIKINPFTWLAKKIGNALTADLKSDLKVDFNELNSEVNKLGDKVNNIETKLEKHINDNKQERAADYRARIIRFNDEIMEEKTHTKEYYDNILEDIDKYEAYCNEHPEYPNNKAVMAIHNIKAKYEEHMENNSFKK